MCSYPYIDFTIYNFHLFKEIWNFQKSQFPTKPIPSTAHFLKINKFIKYRLFNHIIYYL